MYAQIVQGNELQLLTEVYPFKTDEELASRTAFFTRAPWKPEN